MTIHINEITDKVKLNLEDNSEIQYLLYSLWENKWLILTITIFICLLSISYTSLKLPQYEANTLVQIDTKNQSDSLRLTQFYFNPNMTDQVASQIALIQSRVILAPVINKLGLAISVEEKPIPIIGHLFSKNKNNPFIIHKLRVPSNYLNTRLKLKLIDENHYELKDKDNNVLLKGEFKSVAMSNEGFVMKIDNKSAAPGSVFYITRYPTHSIVKQLAAHLRVEELGDSNNSQTGILQISLRDTNPLRLSQILNEIAKLIEKKSVERKLMETSKTLAFLNEQLPIVKSSLDRAELALNRYRSSSGKINIKIQAERMMERLANIENQLVEANMQQAHLLQIYTDKHPIIIDVKHKIEQLKELKSALIQQIKMLPSSDQVAINLIRDVKVKNNLYLLLQNKIHELRVINSGKLSDVRLLATAAPPDTPLPEQNTLVLAASLILGLMLGCITVLIRDTFSRKIIDPQWVEKKLDIPNLAIVPYSKLEISNKAKFNKKMLPKVNILAEQDPRDLSIEALRSLRTSFQILLNEPKKNLISFTGVRKGVGKSFISCNFAYLLANTDKRVLLIDADIRRGDLHHYFSVRQTPGLIEVINGKMSLPDAIQKTSLPQLSFLPCGQYPKNPSELLMTPEFKELLLNVSTQYDYVVIDTAPVLAATDSTIIAAIADINFLVLASNVHQPEEIILTFKQLEQAGIKISGTIFNNLSPKTTNFIKYRYQYYHSYHSDSCTDNP